jgi:hypothetical protein
MNNTRIIIIFLTIGLAFQGTMTIFMINQNIYLQNQSRDKIDKKNNDQLTNDKLRINYEYTLNNNLGSYENTKQWLQYSNTRIPIENYRLKDSNNSPLMEVQN